MVHMVKASKTNSVAFYLFRDGYFLYVFGIFRYPDQFLEHLVRKNDGQVYLNFDL